MQQAISVAEVSKSGREEKIKNLWGVGEDCWRDLSAHFNLCAQLQADDN
jgi:hypothetical protein